LSLKLDYILLPFGELNLNQLYDLMAIRQEVFVVEQNCPYQDADYKDLDAYHLLGYLDDKLVCYTRLLEKGISYDEYCSIGRVVNSSSIRGKGEGKVLMQKSLEACFRLFPGQEIKISAQVYLKEFYEGLGFVSTGEFYDEDDIPHMAMIYKKAIP